MGIPPEPDTIVGQDLCHARGEARIMMGHCARITRTTEAMPDQPLPLAAASSWRLAERR
jgi:hypothetical protein